MAVNGVNNFLTNCLHAARKLDTIANGFRKQGTSVPANQTAQLFCHHDRPAPGDQPLSPRQWTFFGARFAKKSEAGPEIRVKLFRKCNPVRF
jgi:hypothetical protein